MADEPSNEVLTELARVLRAQAELLEQAAGLLRDARAGQLAPPEDPPSPPIPLDEPKCAHGVPIGQGCEACDEANRAADYLDEPSEPQEALPQTTRLGKKILACLAESGPQTSADVSRTLGVSSRDKVLRQMRQLVADGHVIRGGSSRGTRYGLPGSDVRSTEQIMRDVLRKRSPMSTSELATAARRTTGGVLRALTLLEKRGTITHEEPKGSREAWIWSWVKPEGTSPARPKAPTPESVVVYDRGNGGEGPSGRGLRSSNPEVRDLIAECKAAGYEVFRGGKHFIVRNPTTRKTVATIPSTPSDSRSIPNARAAIRRAGIVS